MKNASHTCWQLCRLNQIVALNLRLKMRRQSSAAKQHLSSHLGDIRVLEERDVDVEGLAVLVSTGAVEPAEVALEAQQRPSNRERCYLTFSLPVTYNIPSGQCYRFVSVLK